MRIIIDAMSGDNAPDEIVKGAVEAWRTLGVEIVLVGQEAAIRRCLDENGVDGPGPEVVHASQVIGMHDEPSTAVRAKRDSSMTVGLCLLRDGGGDALVSAGNTGALLSGATLFVKRIPGIRRACMAPVVPNGARGALLIDCGANVDCSEEYLLQFAYMGNFYSRHVLGCPTPRVGLLNIGTEESKGGALQKKTYALLTEADREGRLSFIGNVEAGDIFFDRVDVVVADGFSGNVMLKTIEGTAKFLMGHIREILTGSVKNKAVAALLRKDIGALRRTMDPAEVGGTPFLGIRKPVIKAHGSSNARAIYNAVRQAVAFTQGGVVSEIAQHMDLMRLHTLERVEGEEHK